MRQLLLVVVVLSACAPPPADPSPAAERMLLASAAAWNRGDLDAFLEDFLDDSTTSFVSAGRVHYGWEWIRDNYAPRFAPGAQRDSLRFEDSAARPLGTDHALATARFVLFRGDSVTATGPFTLILTRTDQGWKIIHDHTSRE